MEQITNMGFHAENFVLRGNFALEDRNFQKAEQFFEQALNLDAKCAEAYLGSFLVQVQCSSLEEYIQFRLQETAPAVAAPQPMQKNMRHIEKMAEQYAIEPHLTADAIRTIYQQDFYYDSCVPQRRAQRKQEEALWNEQPLLSRTERLATGAFAQKLTQAKLDFFATLDQRIADAETDDIAAQQTQLLAYEEYLHAIDRQVIQANDAALKGTYIPQKEKQVGKNHKTSIKKNRFFSIAAVLAIVALVICLAAFLPKDKDNSAPSAETVKELTPEEKYAQAEQLLAAGDKRGALKIFRELGDHKDAAARAEEVRLSIIQRNSIVAGTFHTVGLKADGTVVAVGDNEDGQCNVSGWTDMVAISAGFSHTVGLKADGTVIAVGNNKYGQCDVSGWTDIVAISAGGWHTVGLKADGTVVAVGYNENSRCDVSGWTDMVAISAGSWHTVGLKADGIVIAVGDNEDGQCNVSGWTDMVAISAGRYHTVGLKADGTVVAVGYNTSGRCDVSGWTDMVAISAGTWHTVGLKADGTVVAVGYNENGRCDVSGWTDIWVPDEE